MDFMLLKTIHIFSATLLFGTGLGSAYYKFMADRSGSMHTIYKTNQHTVLADWLFTTPAVILQPITGITLALQAGYSFSSFWLLASIILYAIAGLCWIPVVVLQINMREMSKQLMERGDQISVRYINSARIWFYLGIPAFISLIGVYFLMVFKPTSFFSF